MKKLSLFDVAQLINEGAREHPIGTLQELRGHRPGVDLFRLNAKTMQESWACHWGGRKELQFNIGLEEDSTKVRYGVAFSFKESREYKANELLFLLGPKVKAFNRFMRQHVSVFEDMMLWAWDDKNEEISHDGPAGPIPDDVVSENNFVFMGKQQSIARLDTERILNDFDRLLPLYQYVQSEGTNGTHSFPLETNFAFRPGCRTKKRSTIVRQCKGQIERDLRHNALQKALHWRLAKEFGKAAVGTEIQGKNGTSIDLVVQHKRAYWFYEIKTAPSARACIREALGQILEYAFWPGAQEAARLIVAGECAIDKEAEAYLRCLKDRFTLPVRYEQIVL